MDEGTSYNCRYKVARMKGMFVRYRDSIIIVAFFISVFALTTMHKFVNYVYSVLIAVFCTSGGGL